MFAELFQQVKWAVFLRKPYQNLEYRRIQLLRIRLESVILIQQRVEKEEVVGVYVAVQSDLNLKIWVDPLLLNIDHLQVAGEVWHGFS